MNVLCKLIIPSRAGIVNDADGPLDLPENRFRRFMGHIADRQLDFGRIEELDVRQDVRRDLLRQIDAEPLRGDDKGAGRSQRCEHALRFFRRKLCEGAHGAQRFKGIAMVRAHHLGRIQNQLVELQPRFVLPIGALPFLAEQAKDLRMILVAQLPDFRWPVRACVDVRYIEDALHIVGPLRINGVDRPAAPANPEIVLVPLPHGRAGRGVRSLRGDLERAGEIVLVEGRDRPQQLHPVLRRCACVL